MVRAVVLQITYHGLDGPREVKPLYVRRAQREKAVFLCGGTKGDTAGDPVPSGTGFLLTTLGNQNRRFDYLVTAKHVFEGLHKRAEAMYLRVNAGDRSDALRPGEGVTYLKLEKTGWLFHDDPTVDVVVGPLDLVLRPDVNQGVGTFTTRMDSLEGILEAPAYLAKQSDCPWPPYEGEDVIFIGLITHFDGQETNLPVVRKGNVGLITNEPIKGPYGKSQYHVINAQSYPGNSGAPVWAYYERADDGTGLHSFYYLGVLSSGYPELEELRKARNTESGYYNLGVSLVTPIEKVVEILNSPKERKRRDRAGDPDILPVIESAEGNSRGQGD